jgi:hypothetical protein
MILVFGGLTVLWAEHRPVGGITQVVSWLHVEAGMGTGGCVEIVAERDEGDWRGGQLAFPSESFMAQP